MARSQVSGTGSQQALSIVGSAVDKDAKSSVVSANAPDRSSYVSATAPEKKGSHLSANALGASSVLASRAASRLSPVPEMQARAAAAASDKVLEQQTQRPMVKFSQSMPSIIPAASASGSYSPRLPEPKGGGAPSLHWCRDTASDRAAHICDLARYNKQGGGADPHLLRAARLASVHCTRSIPRTRVLWRREYEAPGGPGVLGTAKYVHYKRLGDPLHTWPRLPEERWGDDDEEGSIPPPGTFGHIWELRGQLRTRAGSSQGLRQIGRSSISEFYNSLNENDS
mmetsp:Transcript_44914/g.81995  ORF Transcript_44914/g.81995 Transcript_44914/m.81995 type:complete len:283 (-) Transcript_44914:125-973(-)